MEKHPEIPSEIYGRWWKIMNNEFGDIINGDKIVNPTVQEINDKHAESMTTKQMPISGHQDTRQTNSETRQNTQSMVGQKLYQLIQQEKYIGMSLTEREFITKRRGQVIRNEAENFSKQQTKGL